MLLQPMLATLLHVPASFGYGLLFLLVGRESAGVPLPGETALLTAAVLAAQGRLSLPLVIATAAAAAIIGDNVGYLIGRSGVRRLLTRPGRFERRGTRLLERGEVFFARNGGKAVFLGRWAYASSSRGSRAPSGCRGRASRSGTHWEASRGQARSVSSRTGSDRPPRASSARSGSSVSPSL